MNKVENLVSNTTLIASAMQPIYDKISRIENSVEHFKFYINAIHDLEYRRLFQIESSKPENAGKLWQYGYKVYSQNDEDGMIAEIFKRIGITTKTFIEIGVGNGIECNTAKLLVEGWSGLWFEGQPDNGKGTIEPHFSKRFSIKEVFVTVENINSLLSEASGWGEVDVCSIDVDYNTYWLWKALTVIKPRVVIIEYNALWPPPISLVVPYDHKAVWDITNYYSASLEAMTQMATGKGYSLVGCDLTGTNAFYVRDDLVGDKFLQPYTAEKHYMPVNYNFNHSSGHPSRIAPYLNVVASDGVKL